MKVETYPQVVARVLSEEWSWRTQAGQIWLEKQRDRPRHNPVGPPDDDAYRAANAPYNEGAEIKQDRY